jgi:ribonuclease-3
MKPEPAGRARTLTYTFKNPELWELALTQSGAGARVNNERLEFLGDRVLGLSVAALLYAMFPNESEGELARRLAVLVSTDTLADVAAGYGLEKLVRHGHMTGGRVRHILADAMESVFGAIYLDGGFAAAQTVIADIWTDLARADSVAPKDPKTTLQELVQKRDNGSLPEYKFLGETGPSHAPSFRVTVTALGQSATGGGASKKAATIDAAEKLLETLMKS